MDLQKTINDLIKDKVRFDLSYTETGNIRIRFYHIGNLNPVETFSDKFFTADGEWIYKAPPVAAI